MNVGERQFVDQFDFFRWRVRLGSCFIDTVILTVYPEPVDVLRVSGRLRNLWDVTPGDYSFCEG